MLNLPRLRVAVARAITGISVLLPMISSAQWTFVTADLPGSFPQSVDFLNDDLGLAVGGRTILISNDGGRTWAISDTTTFTGHGLEGVIIDSTIAGVVAVVVGSGQAIGRSPNAGATWRLVHSGNATTLNAACFRGDGNYQAFGEGAWLAQSLDYAISWNTGLVFPSADMDFALCRPDGTTWAGGFWNDAGINRCCGVLMKSTDGGQSWSVAIRPDDPDDGRFVDLQFVSDNVGYALSANSSFRGRSLIWKTVDGGETWERLATNPYMETMLFLDEDHGLLGGLEGLMLQTTDGGLSWTPDTLTPPSNINDFALLSDAVIAVGDFGVFRNESLITLAAETVPASVKLESVAYPNPAAANVTVHFGQPTARAHPLQVDVIDVLGRVVRTTQSKPGAAKLSIFVGDLPSGPYFYRARSDRDRAVGQFLVVRGDR